MGNKRGADRGQVEQRLLILITLGLVAFGLVRVFSATSASATLGEGDPMRLTILLAVIAFVAALCAAVFLLCTRIERLLGVTGNIVLSRLLGVLLAALAVQFVVDGVRAALA